MNYKHGGKGKTIAFGVYPTISLKEARERRAYARELLSKGYDPSIEKKSNRLITNLNSNNTFKSIALEWHDKECEKWTPRYAKQVKSVLIRDFFPFIGNMPITEVSALVLLSTLKKIEERDAFDSASDARSFAGRIFRYAIATGRAERDIAADLKDALKTRKSRHHAYLLEKDLPNFFKKLDNYPGDALTQAALELMLLTFPRTTELRMAEWEEIDLEKAEWRIPEHRMKMRHLHIIPLSIQSTVLLSSIHDLTGHTKYLFPNVNSSHRCMTENTMLHAMYTMGYKGIATVHGFRATASTILNENGFPPDVIERQLAHLEVNKVRKAYNHAQHLPERRKMMQWWADHLDSLKAQS